MTASHGVPAADAVGGRGGVSARSGSGFSMESRRERRDEPGERAGVTETLTCSVAIQ